MLTVPFIIDDKNKGKTYQMNYIVGFIGCDQNEKKEVFPVQAWVVSSSLLNEKEIEIFKDPIPIKLLENQNSSDSEDDRY